MTGKVAGDRIPAPASPEGPETAGHQPHHPVDIIVVVGVVVCLIVNVIILLFMFLSLIINGIFYY